MPNQVQSKDQIGFVQVESTYATIPNSTGTATLAATNAFLVTSLNTDGDQDIIQRPDKTGSLDFILGTGGRKNTKWGMKCTMVGNGAAGVAPDIGPFLQALFGQAPTVVASTSVTYGLADLSPSLSIWNFWKPSTAVQAVAFGGVVDQAVFSLGADVADIDMSGPAFWTVTTDIFSGSDTPGKGGLTAFPSEPSSPVTNGSMSAGFLGTITIDSNSYTSIRSMKITFKANREIPLDVYGQYYGGLPGQDRRQITIDWDMYDDDSAALSSLKLKAITKTPITITGISGVNAGNIWTFTLRNCLVTAPKYNDGQRRKAVSFTAQAYASSPGALDPITLALT